MAGTVGIGKADEEIRIAVGIEIAPGRRAGLLVVGKPYICGDFTESAVIVAIEAVGPAAERDEVVKIAIAVGIGPGAGLASRSGKHVGLDQFKCGRQGS